VGDTESERWLGRLTESEEQLAEFSDSPDPVAQRKIVEALYTKGRALSQLSRSSEALDVWDELLRRLALEGSEGARPVVVRVLLRKAIDLDLLGEKAKAVEAADAVLALAASVAPPGLVRWQVLAALLLKMSAVAPEERKAIAAIDAEIISRFAESSEPVIHEQVTTALLRTGLFYLLEDNLEDAIQMSRILAERFDSAPEETLATEADLVNHYGRALSGFAGTGWRGMAETLAFAFMNILIRLGRVFGERLGGGDSARLVNPEHAPPVAIAHVIPVRWEHARRRFEAVIELQERVISRIGGDITPDLQREATICRIQAASARGALGHLRRGFGELGTLIGSSDPATVQALQSIAVRLRGRSDLPGQLNELAALSARAQALGQGDTKIQQIAYEDSIKPLLADTTHRSVKWLAVLLRPDLQIATELSAKTKAAVRNLTQRAHRSSHKKTPL